MLVTVTTVDRQQHPGRWLRPNVMPFASRKREPIISSCDLLLTGQLTLSTHVTVSPSTSSLTRPRLANSARARQTPCHLASPRRDSAPPKPMVPPEPLPPGSTIVPKELSITGSSSVPENRARVAPTICSWYSSGRIDVILARYLAAEYRTIVSLTLAHYSRITSAYLVAQTTHQIANEVFDVIRQIVLGYQISISRQFVRSPQDSHPLLPIRATHHLPLALIASFRISPEVVAVLEPLRCGSSTSSVNSSNVPNRSGLIKVGRTARNSKMEATRFASPSRSPSFSSCPVQSRKPGKPGAASSLE
jgi:hypothetical protein